MPLIRGREVMEFPANQELFNLSQDIGERHNIAAEHPEIVERLLKELAAFRGQGE